MNATTIHSSDNMNSNNNKSSKGNYITYNGELIDLDLLEPTPINQMSTRMPSISRSVTSSMARSDSSGSDSSSASRMAPERSESYNERSCDPLTIFMDDNTTSTRESRGHSEDTASRFAYGTNPNSSFGISSHHQQQQQQQVEPPTRTISPMTPNEWINVLEVKKHDDARIQPQEPFRKLGVVQTQQQPMTVKPRPFGLPLPPPLMVSNTIKKSPTKKSKKSDHTVADVLPALSAYNFFFREEREILLQRVKDGLDLSEDQTHHGDDADSAVSHNWSKERQDQILARHWFRDRSQKRKHRKTCKGVDFSALSKVVAARWRSLGKEGKEFYQAIAAMDLDRYHRQVREEMSKPATPPTTASAAPAVPDCNLDPIRLESVGTNGAIGMITQNEWPNSFLWV